MKILLFLFLFSCANIFPQLKNEYSPKVEEIMNILEKYRQNLNYIPQPDEFNVTDEELDEILKKMYIAIEDDPEGYINYLSRRNHQHVKDIKEKKLDENVLSIGNIEGLIRKEIEKKYSKKFLTLITTPYFLRVKITNKSEGVYIDRQGSPHEQFVINCKIEEVLKGSKRFTEGEYISFVYLKSLRCLRNYEIGNTYFIPFTVTTLETSNYEGLHPQWFDCTGNYLIENENIRIPENYFEIAEETSWVEFKQHFIDKYIIK